MKDEIFDEDGAVKDEHNPEETPITDAPSEDDAVMAMEDGYSLAAGGPGAEQTNGGDDVTLGSDFGNLQI